MFEIFKRFKKKEKLEENPDCANSKDGYGDYQQWLICKKKGHIAVNSFDAWLCLRCWTGYLMGMRFPVKDEIREAIKKGEIIKGRFVIGVSPEDTLFSSKGSLRYAEVYKTGKSPFVEGVEIISYDAAIARGENTKPPDEGGPPYVIYIEKNLN